MSHKISSFLSDRVVITGLVLDAYTMEAGGSGQAALTQMGRDYSSGTAASPTETIMSAVFYCMLALENYKTNRALRKGMDSFVECIQVDYVMKSIVCYGVDVVKWRKKSHSAQSGCDRSPSLTPILFFFLSFFLSLLYAAIVI